MRVSGRPGNWWNLSYSPFHVTFGVVLKSPYDTHVRGYRVNFKKNIEDTCTLRVTLRVPPLFFNIFLFRGNRQIPGLAAGAVGHSLFYSRRYRIFSTSESKMSAVLSNLTTGPHFESSRIFSKIFHLTAEGTYI